MMKKITQIFEEMISQITHLRNRLSNLRNHFHNLRKQRCRGQSIVEYVIIFGAIVLAVVGIGTIFQMRVAATLIETVNKIP